MFPPGPKPRGSHARRYGLLALAHDPEPVVTRGKTSIARHTPSAQRTDCNRQVSWLPGQRVRHSLPGQTSSGGAIGRILSGHSCGGSLGSWRVGHFRVPFSSHVLGTCRGRNLKPASRGRQELTHIVLLLGGARSGKSRIAQVRAEAL